MTVNVNINVLGCPYAGAPFMKGKDMEVNVKTTRLENSDNNIKGLATMTIGNAFKVQSISIVEGKTAFSYRCHPIRTSTRMNREMMSLRASAILSPGNSERI